MEKELVELLGLLKALHVSHWMGHWRVHGPTQYGDHLLLERMYTAVVEEIDTLAEKIVAYYGPEVLEDTALEATTLAWLQQVLAAEPLARALELETLLQRNLKKTYSSLKGRDVDFSLGLDDFLMGLAEAHETHLYLLRQRLRRSS
jgi:DNA-binding ferritin-like protein